MSADPFDPSNPLPSPATPAPTVLADDAFEPARRRRPPGPGILESLVWSASFHVLSLITLFALMIAFMVAYGGWMVANGQDPRGMVRQVEDREMEINAYLLFADMFVMIPLIMLLAWVRIGKGTWRKLNLARPSFRQTALVALLVFPTASLSEEFYHQFNAVWEPFIEAHPELKWTDALNNVENMPAIAGAMPLWMFVLTIAVTPAIVEELIFRGIIGRGLLARYGFTVSMVVSSVLFGFAHLHPSHVAGVLPIGMVIFLVYYFTRNFWMPMLFHFVNNANAAIVTKWALANDKAELLEHGETTNWLLVTLAAGCTAVILTTLASMRTRYRDEAGSEWEPPHRSLEAPPRDAGFRRFIPHPPIPLALLTAVMVGLFGVAVVRELQKTDNAQPSPDVPAARAAAIPQPAVEIGVAFRVA